MTTVTYKRKDISIQKKVDDLTEQLVQKDSLIDKLKSENDNLKAENQKLRDLLAVHGISFKNKNIDRDCR